MNYHNPDAGKGFGIAGLVVGIIGLLLFCIPFVGFFFGFLGLIFSIVGLVQANKAQAQKGLIIGALVVSIIATLIGTGYFAIIYQAKDNQFFEEFFDSFDNSDYYNDDNNFYDIQDELDKQDADFDSLNIDSTDVDDLDKTMTDKENGPGPAPGD